MVFDEIIVGGGPSGAVLAARLSEDPWRRVLLLEAGPHYADLPSTPKSLLNGRHMPWDHDWGFSAEMVPGRSAAYQRGKVTGGSSSVNACLALRGAPADYDEWAAMGNPAWSWPNVLPVFIQIEDDAEAPGQHHGIGGPTPIRRCAAQDLWPAQKAFLAACQELGFPVQFDQNHPEATGAGPVPTNLGPGYVRASTAIAYLLDAQRRANLTILPGCLVSRVLFHGRRAIGVEVQEEAGVQAILGHRVTLSAGAIGSPAILLRSGVGPAEELRALGIETRIDLPGVGRNLVDHACLRVKWDAPHGIVEAHTPHLQAVLSYTAPGSPIRNDMQAFLFQWPIQPSLWLQTSLMKPASRGMLTLRSPTALDQPEIRLNLASDVEDGRRLADGLRLLDRLLRTGSLQALGADRLTLNDGEMLPAMRLATLVQDDDWVEQHIQRAVHHYVHPVGTSRMGPADDPGAVVDQCGSVQGATGLRVVDASIMPTIPRANTHLTCVMIAERAARWMRSQDG